MELVNLTPHKITIYLPAANTLAGDDNSPVVVEPSGPFVTTKATLSDVSA